MARKKTTPAPRVANVIFVNFDDFEPPGADDEPEDPPANPRVVKAMDNFYVKQTRAAQRNAPGVAGVTLPEIQAMTNKVATARLMYVYLRAMATTEVDCRVLARFEEMVLEGAVDPMTVSPYRELVRPVLLFAEQCKTQEQ